MEKNNIIVFGGVKTKKKEHRQIKCAGLQDI